MTYDNLNNTLDICTKDPSHWHLAIEEGNIYASNNESLISFYGQRNLSDVINKLNTFILDHPPTSTSEKVEFQKLSVKIQDFRNKIKIPIIGESSSVKAAFTKVFASLDSISQNVQTESLQKKWVAIKPCLDDTTQRARNMEFLIKAKMEGEQSIIEEANTLFIPWVDHLLAYDDITLNILSSGLKEGNRFSLVLATPQEIITISELVAPLSHGFILNLTNDELEETLPKLLTPYLHTLDLSHAERGVDLGRLNRMLGGFRGYLILPAPITNLEADIRQLPEANQRLIEKSRKANKLFNSLINSINNPDFVINNSGLVKNGETWVLDNTAPLDVLNFTMQFERDLELNEAYLTPVVREQLSSSLVGVRNRLTEKENIYFSFIEKRVKNFYEREVF